MRKRLPALLLCLALLLSGCGGTAEELPLGNRIRNCDAVVASIRQGLRQHASSVTIRFDYGSDIFSELNGVVDLWVAQALEETEDPAEGDYIRYQFGGYTWSSSKSFSEGRWHYTVEIVPDYYCYLFQEEAVNEEVARLMETFHFSRKTPQAEKIRTIYEYLCRNVSYDKVHRKNPNRHLKSTAYAALINRSATCQGYCAALYRLLREAGVTCRIVTGSAEGEELHAWVIAELDGLYYGLDPTWDAGADEWRFFLAGTQALADRTPAEQFLTEEFTAAFPMAAESYVFEETRSR